MQAPTNVQTKTNNNHKEEERATNLDYILGNKNA